MVRQVANTNGLLAWAVLLALVVTVAIVGRNGRGHFSWPITVICGLFALVSIGLGIRYLYLHFRASRMEHKEDEE